MTTIVAIMIKIIICAARNDITFGLQMRKPNY